MKRKVGGQLMKNELSLIKSERKGCQSSEEKGKLVQREVDSEDPSAVTCRKGR